MGRRTSTHGSAGGAEDCLFAHNQCHGLHGEAKSSEFVGYQLFGCTVAHNQGAGLSSVFGADFTVGNSIVAGNGDDFATQFQPVQASWSNCEDGDFLGNIGCIAADPLFVEALAGDFRLRFGSPSVDAGDPAAFGTSDLPGRPRNVDGDLDVLARTDMGAYELETLAGPTVVQPGGAYGVVVAGAAGATSFVLLALHPLPHPARTPYGALAVSRVSLLLGPLVHGVGGNTTLPFVVPPGAASLGTSPTFQAITSSSAAPLGAALSNALQCVVSL